MLGPVMIDLEHTALSAEEREILLHPLVGGLIYFTRNFESREQITELSKEIKSLRSNLLICVDHEGGRVQRFRDGFSLIPACGQLGKLHNDHPHDAHQASREMGWLMAIELLSCTIDFSFAPVLDLNFGTSDVIGDRAFAADPENVAALASEFMLGMREAGMANVGKHYPGHGFVAADSHLDLPVDKRSLNDLLRSDIIPFMRLIENKVLDAVMPAHVIYEQVDNMPAGFSEKWIKQILRKQLQFNGIIFSDDLNMAAAHIAGTFAQRAEVAMRAGCDMVLICNNRAGVIEVLEQFNWKVMRENSLRLERMLARQIPSYTSLMRQSRWSNATAWIDRLNIA